MARWTDPPSIDSVRQLASLRPRPAIAVVSVHSWCRATFVKRVEDEADGVCKHYNISCLSQRRALEPLVSAGILTKEQLVGKDCIHPINGPLGVDTVAAIIHHWFDKMHTPHTRAALAGAPPKYKIARCHSQSGRRIPMPTCRTMAGDVLRSDARSAMERALYSSWHQLSGAPHGVHLHRGLG